MGQEIYSHVAHVVGARRTNQIIAAKNAARDWNPCRPPDEGTHLTTLVVHRRLEGRIEQMDLLRGDRANNFHLLINGQFLRESICATDLSIALRKAWVPRWIVCDF